jgi:cobalt-zinc-cadmium efflux system protein
MTLSESEIILRRVKDLLNVEFHIMHTTIQFENGDCEIAHGCVIPIGSATTREALRVRR